VTSIARPGRVSWAVPGNCTVEKLHRSETASVGNCIPKMQNRPRVGAFGRQIDDQNKLVVKLVVNDAREPAVVSDFEFFLGILEPARGLEPRTC
jgi:hypothetical protein